MNNVVSLDLVLLLNLFSRRPCTLYDSYPMQKGGIPESKLQVTTHQGSDADSLAFTGRNLNEYDYQYEYVELYDGTGTPHTAAKHSRRQIDKSVLHTVVQKLLIGAKWSKTCSAVILSARVEFSWPAV